MVLVRGFWRAVMAAFRQYLGFSGRASRMEFWLFVLCIVLVAAALDRLEWWLWSFDDSHEWALATPWGRWTGHASLLVMAWLVAVFMPFWAAASRRIHDIGMSDRWLWVSMTGIGVLVMLYWFCKPGMATANRFGPPPSFSL